jgi:hypothetical protein
MYGVFHNIDIDPLPPPHRPASACTTPPLVRGEDTLAEWEGGGGSIFWKTPDTALYSTYVSTLYCTVFSKLCTGFTLYNAVNHRLNMELDTYSMY